VGEEITPENAGEAVARVRQHLGFLFQSGALFEFLTVAENVALPLEEFTDLPPELIAGIVQLKLDLVELGQYGHLMPGELSGHVFVFACERTGPISRAALQIEVSLIDTDEAPRRVIFRREYNLRSGPFAEDSSAAFAQAMSGLVAEFSLKLQQDLCAAQKN
jgi:ABC-type taurine transport system ATPase subunit